MKIKVLLAALFVCALTAATSYAEMPKAGEMAPA